MSQENLRWLGVGVAGVLGFLAIAYAVLELAPNLFAETEGLDAKGRADARQGVRTASLALLAGGIAVIGAIYTARTFALNREGQLTDRFSKAIEQLGHKELDVRLGGIYALERIARDSKEDHPQVMEVLTAYVREHAPRKDVPDEVSEPEREAPKPEPSPRVRVRPLPRPPTDVQAVVTVLARRRAEHDRAAEYVLDLSRTALQGVHMQKGNFAHTNFSSANLGRALLNNAVLTNASLVSTDLRRARLTEADLSNSRMSNTQLGAAVLDGADLSGIPLRVRSEELIPGMYTADLEDAKYDEHTTWPRGFDPKAAGAIPKPQRRRVSRWRTSTPNPRRGE